MNRPSSISATAAPMSVNTLHYTQDLLRAGSRISPADLRVRAGQLLNDAGDGNDHLARLRRDAADHLAEAAHHLAKIDRLSRVGGQ